MLCAGPNRRAGGPSRASWRSSDKAEQAPACAALRSAQSRGWPLAVDPGHAGGGPPLLMVSIVCCETMFRFHSTGPNRGAGHAAVNPGYAGGAGVQSLGAHPVPPGGLRPHILARGTLPFNLCWKSIYEKHIPIIRFGSTSCAAWWTRATPSPPRCAPATICVESRDMQELGQRACIRSAAADKRIVQLVCNPAGGHMSH